MSYEAREYLWDRIRGGPCIVIGVQPDREMYTVAEIVGNPPKLGRVASRLEPEVCRYVKAIIPEDEAAQIQATLEYEGLESEAGRIREAREKRGVA